MGSISKIMNLFSNIRSADHIGGVWDAGDYQLDETFESGGHDRLPAMMVDARSTSAFAEYNWVTLPSYASFGYMLSTRRI